MEIESNYTKETIEKAKVIQELMDYDDFRKALDHALLVERNEAVEKELQAKVAPIYAEWKNQYQEEQKAIIETEKLEFLESGLSQEAYAMKKYYNGYGYKGD